MLKIDIFNCLPSINDNVPIFAPNLIKRALKLKCYVREVGCIIDSDSVRAVGGLRSSVVRPPPMSALLSSWIQPRDLSIFIFKIQFLKFCLSVLNASTESVGWLFVFR